MINSLQSVRRQYKATPFTIGKANRGYGCFATQAIERNGSGTFALRADVPETGPPKLRTERSH